ncbi:MAG: GAF domain-containing protein [Dehalococcoidia bacterium]
MQHVVDLAREMTNARYTALAVSDEQDRTEGFVTSGLTKAQLRGLKMPPQGHGPLGRLPDRPHPVRYSDLDTAENAFGFPPKHPPMKTLLGVPIIAAGGARQPLRHRPRQQPIPSPPTTMRRSCAILARHAGGIIERDWY